MSRPQDDEYAAFYRGYVEAVHEEDILAALGTQREVLAALPALVPSARETFAYAPGKWSIRQLVGHLADGERVFGYRAFAFSRFDTTALPGFDENAYVSNARSHDTPLAALVDELVLLRRSNEQLLAGLDEAQWCNTGTANGKTISVRALAFIMVGHARHHLGILRERYGVPLP
ncbi:MAG: DinB family protein [Planctomycetota bacterium]